MNQKESAYIIYEVLKCTDETRNKTKLDSNCNPETAKNGICEEVDPPCASNEKIAELLEYKRIHFRVIDSNVNFNNFTSPIR